MLLVDELRALADGVAAFTLDEDEPVCADGGGDEDAGAGAVLLGERGECGELAGGVSGVSARVGARGAGGNAYSARYIGSLVADFHRTLLKGGVFLYPPTEKTPKGKLRLLYEAYPLAMIAEQAGGAAVNGERRILEVQAEGIHAADAAGDWE